MREPSAIKDLMASLLKVSPESLQDGALLTDLVTESFLLVDFVIDLQDCSDVRLTAEDLRGIRTVGDLVALMERAG